MKFADDSKLEGSVYGEQHTGRTGETEMDET